VSSAHADGLVVSVVVPAFDREATLPRTLDSLIAQTCTDWEAIVVDDGSRDGTAAVVERYAARDPRIRLWRQANAGVSRARNAGIELARAPWLFFLDADDWIVPTAFESLLAAIANEPDAGLVYGGYVRVDEAGRELRRGLHRQEDDYFPVFACTCAISIHSCVVRTEVVRRAGGFDASLVTCEDWDLWQRVARLGTRFVRIPEYVAYYRMRRGSASGDGWRMLRDGLHVIERGHDADPRIATLAPAREPLSRISRDSARTYFTTYAAGLEIAAGGDPTTLLDALDERPSGDVDASGVAMTLFDAVPVGLARPPAEWEDFPLEVHRACDRFIDALGERAGSHWLAFTARTELTRKVLAATRAERPRQVGQHYLIELDLAGEPPRDLVLDGGITRVLCAVRYGTRPLGDVEIPVVDGWLPARVLADAIVARMAWDLLAAHFEAHVYPALGVDASLHDEVGWATLLRELFELPWERADDFYAERDGERGEPRGLAAGETLMLDVADPVPLLEVGADRASIDVGVTVGGVPLTVVRCDARDGRVTPSRLRRTILLQTGFELCRAVLREAVVLAPVDAEGTLRRRLTTARARRESLLPAGATVVGRGAGPDGTSVSRWAVFPAEAAGERLALADVDGDAVAGPRGERVKRLLCAPLPLDGAGAHPHPSDDATLRLLAFERIFGGRSDPWDYDSAYEQEKYRQTLGLLPERVEHALEVGCAEGVFTRLLAERVRRLTAADISPRALARARERCADSANVAFAQLDLFAQPLAGRYDLIVCSELLYYAPDRAALRRTAEALADALEPGGTLLAAHAHAVVDDARAPGFDWEVPFGAVAIEQALRRTGLLELEAEVRTEPYRVQRYRRLTRRRRLPARRRPARTNPDAAPMTAEQLARFLPHGGPVRREPPEPEVTSGRRLPILMYHRVAPDGAADTRRYRLHPDAFEAQLSYLREHGYRSLTFEQWRVAADRRIAIPARSVMLTFDDGYADFPAYALPLLRRYGYEASMFVVTDLVGGTNEWDRAAGETIELMDWPTLLGLREHGIELGSHTSSHRPLIALSAAEIARELCRSRAELQERTGAAVRSVCYPYGLNDVAVRSLAAASGFHYGVTTDEWPASYGDELLGLPRIEVRGTESLTAFVRLLEA
jgi:peptidoglycan/xylan/chitin deacetylase (PgdA/CDA1 family)/GT2 family glycosyltransferase/SAM-dependent methyltransferase